MNNLTLLALAVWLAGFAAAGAEPVSSADAEPQPALPAARGMVVTSGTQRGEAVGAVDTIHWFEVNGARVWLAEQAAPGAVRGAVLLLAAAQTGANGSDHLASLRRSLPVYGWHTYFLNMPGDGSAADLLAGARAQMPAVDRVVLICEGVACLHVPTAADDGIDATVFINVPLAADTRVDPGVTEQWRSFAPPGLILQEYPHGWPRALGLAEDFELHVLPAGRKDRDNSRVSRKLRGWLQRRLQAG